jgi:hypothetical protein
MAESPIVIVKKESCRDVLSNHFWNVSDFLLEQSNILKFVNLISCGIVEPNVEALRPVDCVCVLTGGLSDYKLSYLAILRFILSRDFVASFSLQPVSGPLVQILLLFDTTCINCLLNCSNEVWQCSVSPLILVKVYL